MILDHLSEWKTFNALVAKYFPEKGVDLYLGWSDDGERRITLDGEFSTEDLEKVIALLKELNEIHLHGKKWSKQDVDSHDFGGEVQKSKN